MKSMSNQHRFNDFDSMSIPLSFLLGCNFFLCIHYLIQIYTCVFHSIILIKIIHSPIFINQYVDSSYFKILSNVS